MSVAEPPASNAGAGYDRPAPQVKRRPLGKRVMHIIRRAHLYLGLFLLPWAVLYGFTGFLFNHPTAFSDAPSVSFGATELAGTPMEAPPKPAEIAGQVVAALNERAKGEHTYALVEPEKAKYTRDLAFATAKAEGQDVNIAIDVNNASGTVRSRNTVAPPPKSEEKAPFAISGAKGGLTKGGGGGGRGEKGGGGGGRGEKGGGAGADKGRGEKSAGGPKGESAPLAAPPQTGLQLPEPLHERVKAAARTVLERTGFPTDELAVTSVPDLTFRMSEGEKVWTVTYNAQNGNVNGASADTPTPPEELSTRLFLTRLHRAHGFPGSANARWFWAVIVDVMAFVMVFWGVSGVFMWWQLKATRKLGFALVLFGACIALALGFGMHDLMTAR